MFSINTQKLRDLNKIFEYTELNKTGEKEEQSKIAKETNRSC